ncbi:hypothetical protein V1515DRAFT_579500 [Lipomyces mesembrius]
MVSSNEIKEAGFDETVPAPQEKAVTKKLMEGWYWYRPGISREEKILVFKLDLSILILLFGCLSAFTKTLDNQALTNAYVTPSWLLKQSEIELANKRLEEEGIMKIKKKINWRALTRVLKGWPWYCFVFAWCLYDQNQFWGTTPFSLYLKASDRITLSPKLTTIRLSVKPLRLFDGDRFSPALLGAILVASGSIILVVWNVSEGARFYAFFIDGAETAMSTFLMSWASDVAKHDSEARSIITASMNCIGQVFLAWVPIFTFNVTKAPRFTVGFIFSMVTGILYVVLACFIQVLDVRRKREEKRRVLLIDAGHGNDADVIDLDNQESHLQQEKNISHVMFVYLVYST